MNWKKDEILEVLDQGASAFTFPMLDNGYVYLSATRMSVYRSESDWAIVIEVFGFSPRAGDPDTHIYTFSSNLHNKKTSSDYVSEEAYKNYLRNNPYNESRFVFPIHNSDWQEEEEPEYIKNSGYCLLRGNKVALPELEEYKLFGISLEEDRPLVFEFCRFLAGKYRDDVLGTENERRVNVAPDMELLFQLDEWNHPDIAGDELPSASETFIQIAEAIVTGNKTAYHATKKSNTHWENWPLGGTL